MFESLISGESLDSSHDVKNIGINDATRMRKLVLFIVVDIFTAIKLVKIKFSSFLGLGF